MPLHISGMSRIVVAWAHTIRLCGDMIKFMILFRQPEDLDKFENVYQDFLALVERIPQIQRRQVAHVTGSPVSSPEFYRILEIYFESQEIGHEALMTPVGQEAGKELNRLPSESFQLLFADVYEEEGGSTPQPVADTTEDSETTAPACDSVTASTAE